MIPAAYWFFLLLGLIFLGAAYLLLTHGPQNLVAGIITEFVALGLATAGLLAVLVQVVVWLFIKAGRGD